MTDSVDELFGDGASGPKPRLLRVWLTLLLGLLLCVLGLACISVPGGLLVLLAVMFADTEKDRLESGFLSEVDRPVIMRTRAAAYVGMLLSAAIVLLQCWLYTTGVYSALGDLFLAGPPPDWITNLIQ
jgi:hypothetical protein